MPPSPTDRQRLADAVRFYLERCGWSPGDRERAEYVRLLAELESA